MATRPIPFAPGYTISDDGVVASSKYGSARVLKPWRNGTLGHLMVGLRIDGVGVRLLVHRIVALVFLPPPEDGESLVRHLDGNPRNNLVGNLAWGTYAANTADMMRHGRHGAVTHPERVARGDRHGLRKNPAAIVRGEAHSSAKLTADEVAAIRQRAAAGERQSTLAREHGVTPQLIHRICKRACWKHVA